MERVIGLIVFEFILGYALQAYTFILGIYAFVRRKIVLKEYVKVASLFAVCSILVRQLPIHFGVHTIINMIICFLISIFILKMPIYTSIRSTLVSMMLLIVWEIANVGLLHMVFGQNAFESLMLDRLYKAILGIPGVLMFTISIVVSYVLLTKEKVPPTNQGDDVGNIST